MVNNLWTVDDVFNPKSEFWKKMYGDVDSYFNNMDKTEIDTIHKRAFQDRISDFVDYFKSLSKTDKPKVVREIEQSEEIVSEVLWNLVGKNDREILFHNDIDYFNDFIDTCPDPLLEVYINKLASGESLLNYAVREHLKPAKEKKKPEESNNIKNTPTPVTVQVIDGKLVISSTNLKALKKFSKIMIENGNRVEAYKEETPEYSKTIYSYIFTIKQED
jgi:hypothetical protein